MNTNSAYEGYLNRTGLVCLGQVISVDSDYRSLRVKTIGLQGTDDLDLRNVPILHQNWHPEGDEDVALPRPDTYGVILFLGPQPLWIGAYPLDMSSGEKQRSNMQSLNPGDRIIATVADNRIIVRTGGTIEIQSTDLCRTFWIPSQNLINTVCQNFELETSGGRLHWTIDDDTEDTNLQLQVWNNLNPDNQIQIDIGTVPDDNNEEVDSDIKPFDAADLVLDFRQGTPDDKLAIAERTMRMSLKKDGSIYLDIGPSKFSMTIDAATGDVTFQTQGTVKGTVQKDVDLTVEGEVKATVTGNVEVTTSADANVTASGNINAKGSKITLNGESSGITTANSHDQLIDYITGIPVKPSQTVFGDI